MFDNQIVYGDKFSAKKFSRSISTADIISPYRVNSSILYPMKTTGNSPVFESRFSKVAGFQASN